MTDESESADDSVDDIELAYREAMKSLDDAEAQVGSALMELSEDYSEDSQDEELPFTSIGEELAEDLESDVKDNATEETVVDGEQRVSPRSVIEAAIFVGGEVSLTAKTLASLIGQDTDARVAVKIIDEINHDYAEQNRPYEIRLREGGFRLELIEKFANVQMKVFGLGPREVKLSPDILEVLAFVAYNQPATKQDLETIDHKKTQGNLRRLIRLQLVEVERNGKKRSDITYKTGQKFLDLFGLADISELPQSDVFNFK